MEFLTGLVTGGAAVGFLSWALKLLLETRLRSSIQNEYNERLEEFKQVIRNQDRIEDTKWKIKHDACLEALELIDVYLSQNLLDLGTGNTPTLQKMDIAHARRCHSKLIITCSDTSLIDAFTEICFKNMTSSGFKKPPTDLLNIFRNKIRHELGFGNEVQLDPQTAWFSSIGEASHPNLKG
jgi:hypothetical protein